MNLHPLANATSACIALSMVLAACAPSWRDGWGPQVGGSMMGGWLMLSLYGLLGTFLAVLAALFVFRWLTGGGSSGAAALDLLKQRYAKGEISPEEFERAKKDIAS